MIKRLSRAVFGRNRRVEQMAVNRPAHPNGINIGSAEFKENAIIVGGQLGALTNNYYAEHPDLNKNRTLHYDDRKLLSDHIRDFVRFFDRQAIIDKYCEVWRRQAKGYFFFFVFYDDWDFDGVHLFIQRLEWTLSDGSPYARGEKPSTFHRIEYHHDGEKPAHDEYQLRRWKADFSSPQKLYVATPELKFATPEAKSTASYPHRKFYTNVRHPLSETFFTRDAFFLSWARHLEDIGKTCESFSQEPIVHVFFMQGASQGIHQAMCRFWDKLSLSLFDTPEEHIDVTDYLNGALGKCTSEDFHLWDIFIRTHYAQDHAHFNSVHDQLSLEFSGFFSIRDLHKRIQTLTRETFVHPLWPTATSAGTSSQHLST